MPDPTLPADAPDLSSLTRTQRWIVLHDRSLLFATVYILLTVLLSIYVSYFWLFAVVGVHLLLEWLKKGYLGYRPGAHRIAWTVWDIKFDVALLCMALALLSYTGVPAGVAGTQSAARLGVFGGRFSTIGTRLAGFFSRFGGLGQLLQKLGLKAVDLFFSARVFLFRQADISRSRARESFLDKPLVAGTEAEEGAVARECVPQHLPWQRRLPGKAWFALIVITVNLVAVLLAPLLTAHSYASLLDTLLTKLHPWPF